MRPMKRDLVIKGDQIYLRPITVEDTENVVRWRNAKEVVENFIYRKPVTVQDHLNWLKNKVETGLVHQFIICGIADDSPLGSVYLQNIEEENRKAESGIFIGEQAAYGKGIGTEAVKLLLIYAFCNLGLHKVTARILAYNQASIHLHYKAGYAQEALLREELFLDGKYEDLLLFGVLNGARV